MVDLERFLHDGFVRIDEAFSRDVAAEALSMLWEATGCAEADPSTWTRPVVRVGEQGASPFREAVNTPTLHAAFDALVGPGGWLPRSSLGTFPIRFPSTEDPGDCGWHIDVSFGWETEPDFMKWRANIASRGRALLMLFLFSDIAEDDAPTRLRVGSHLDIARQLAPHGDEGLTLGELAAEGFSSSAHRPEALAMGPAGTVFLCHPFLVHSAQPLRTGRPRFIAQPPLLPNGPLAPDSAVARAIALATRGA